MNSSNMSSSRLAWLVAMICVSVAAAQNCPLSSITIDQTATGRSVESKPEWKVKITSQCLCSVSNLNLLCPKFLSSIKVSSPDLKISINSDGTCAVETLNPLHKNDSVVFTYAWDPIQFQPLSFDQACS